MILDEDKYAEGIILVCCFIAIGIAFGYPAQHDKDYQTWVSGYPKEASAGSAIGFDLWLQGPAATFAADVYVDESLAGSSSITSSVDVRAIPLSVPPASTASLGAGTHRVTVKIYDPAQNLYVQNSKFIPYTLFFDVKIS